MDKKFLAELQSKTQLEFREYRKKLIKNPSEIHSGVKKLGEMKGPIIQSEPHSFEYGKEKIWSQIPFAGSLIISIFNVSKNMCLGENGFESNDIQDLIRLAKETGKIKFVLQTDALKYEGLDYLDPIFEEFEPPCVYGDVETDRLIDEKDSEKWAKEYLNIGFKKYFKELRYNVIQKGGSEKFAESLIFGRGDTWEKMRILGMDEEVEHLGKVMIDNPEEAEALFSLYIMKLSPMFDPITKNYNFSLARLNKYNVIPDTDSNIGIPELGRTILNKLVLNPENYYGCVNAIQKYEDNDLYKLLESFQNALIEKKGEKILDSKKTLEEIVDNVWNDVKKSSEQIKGIKSGLSIALGIGGTFGTTALQGATSIEPGLAPIAALGGLLAGLGFNTFESHFTVKKNLSERMIRAFKPNYLVNILDFSKKYDIK